MTMRRLSFSKHTSIFKSPGGTSRGVLTTKDSWIVKVWNDDNKKIIGTGEVSIIDRLSIDPANEIELILDWLIDNIHKSDTILYEELADFPAIRFGLESGLIDLQNGGKQLLFDSAFSQGKSAVPINGLVWMGTFEEMHERIAEKLKEGFSCIKIKVGAIDFQQELDLLKQVRKEFSAQELEIRVDANGGFNKATAEESLKKLAEYQLHSIEQPIKQGQWQEMAKLCSLNIIAIALDEELIGVEVDKRNDLLTTIKPQFIVLKPSLLGGFACSDVWIQLAERQKIGWWATSALETNIGLNAIAQWVATKNNKMPQGLGTGQLFTNNFASNLTIRNGELWLNS